VVVVVEAVVVLISALIVGHLKSRCSKMRITFVSQDAQKHYLRPSEVYLATKKIQKDASWTYLAILILSCFGGFLIFSMFPNFVLYIFNIVRHIVDLGNTPACCWHTTYIYQNC
jgi:nitrate/nitrite transporter NarK